MSGRDGNMDDQVKHWSRSFWVLMLNQLFILGPFTLLAAAMLRESYRACEAASLELPGMTEWYIQSVGPVGMLLAEFISIGVSFCSACIRKHFSAVLITSVSFFAGIIFLGGGMLSSIAPLLVAIRDTLPPEQRW